MSRWASPIEATLIFLAIENWSTSPTWTRSEFNRRDWLRSHSSLARLCRHTLARFGKTKSLSNSRRCTSAFPKVTLTIPARSASGTPRYGARAWQDLSATEGRFPQIAKEAEDTDAMQAWLMAERYLAAQIDEQSYSDQGSIVDSSHEDSATPLATGRREQDSSDRENLSGVGRQDYNGTSAYVSNDKAALAGSYRQGNAAFHGASGDQPEIGLGRGNSASVGEPASLRAAGSMGNLPLSGSIAAFRLASKGCQASHRPSVMGNADGDPGARSNAMETKGEDQDGVQWLRIMRNILRNVLNSIVDQVLRMLSFEDWLLMQFRP